MSSERYKQNTKHQNKTKNYKEKSVVTKKNFKNKTNTKVKNKQSAEVKKACSSKNKNKIYKMKQKQKAVRFPKQLKKVRLSTKVTYKSNCCSIPWHCEWIKNHRCQFKLQVISSVLTW